MTITGHGHPESGTYSSESRLMPSGVAMRTSWVVEYVVTGSVVPGALAAAETPMPSRPNANRPKVRKNPIRRHPIPPEWHQTPRRSQIYTTFEVVLSYC